MLHVEMKKKLKKKQFVKKFENVTFRLPMIVHAKILAYLVYPFGQREHINTNVVFHYIDKEKNWVCPREHFLDPLLSIL